MHDPIGYLQVLNGRYFTLSSCGRPSNLTPLPFGEIAFKNSYLDVVDQFGIRSACMDMVFNALRCSTPSVVFVRFTISYPSSEGRLRVEFISPCLSSTVLMVTLAARIGYRFNHLHNPTPQSAPAPLRDVHGNSLLHYALRPTDPPVISPAQWRRLFYPHVYRSYLSHVAACLRPFAQAGAPAPAEPRCFRRDPAHQDNWALVDSFVSFAVAYNAAVAGAVGSSCGEGREAGKNTRGPCAAHEPVPAPAPPAARGSPPPAAAAPPPACPASNSVFKRRRVSIAPGHADADARARWQAPLPSRRPRVPPALPLFADEHSAPCDGPPGSAGDAALCVGNVLLLAAAGARGRGSGSGCVGAVNSAGLSALHEAALWPPQPPGACAEARPRLLRDGGGWACAEGCLSCRGPRRDCRCADVSVGALVAAATGAAARPPAASGRAGVLLGCPLLGCPLLPVDAVVVAHALGCGLRLDVDFCLGEAEEGEEAVEDSPEPIQGGEGPRAGSRAGSSSVLSRLMQR